MSDPIDYFYYDGYDDSAAPRRKDGGQPTKDWLLPDEHADGPTESDEGEGLRRYGIDGRVSSSRFYSQREVEDIIAAFFLTHKLMYG